MKKIQLLLILLIACVFSAKATNDEDTSALKLDDELLQTLKLYDSVEKMPYKTGSVKIGNNLATINIPAGFKLYDGVQTGFIMGDVFNNPPATYLGMLMKEDVSVLSDSSWLLPLLMMS